MPTRLVFALLIALVGGLWFAGCSSDPGKDIKSENADTRLKAIRDLAARATAEDVQKVAEATRHEHMATAVEAASSLGRIRRPEAVQALRTAATKDQRVEVRQMSVTSLGDQETPDAALALRDVLRSDADPRVRGEAAASLGRMGNLDDVEFLVGILGTEQDQTVQSRAVAAIERMLRIKFMYEPNAPAKERQEALARVKANAPDLAKQLKALRASGGVRPVKEGK